MGLFTTTREVPTLRKKARNFLSGKASSVAAKPGAIAGNIKGNVKNKVDATLRLNNTCLVCGKSVGRIRNSNRQVGGFVTCRRGACSRQAIRILMQSQEK